MFGRTSSLSSGALKSKTSRVPSGILLHGPPGNGKTLFVSSLSATTTFNKKSSAEVSKTKNNEKNLLITVKITPSTFLRSFVGETGIRLKAFETLVSKLKKLQLYSKNGLIVVFIDEADSLFYKRSSSNRNGNSFGGGGGGSSREENEVYRDLKTEFMQFWDGIIKSKADENENKVLMVAATNR